MYGCWGKHVPFWLVTATTEKDDLQQGKQSANLSVTKSANFQSAYLPAGLFLVSQPPSEGHRL